ncbi:ABC transporter ATP-binding protein [Pseudorhodoferax sp. Leaf274]|uniref:ABC transporter ATP-binding protein n=1 Tax=Pseudorhodoferax sp. Leaf274 TaxID=1736318 RepID=UPI000702EC29|nr:ABC transporter ATP-binding protein [Pseudorhodoferax sp. Leaf274]KQP41139.1 ABC transporter [Pseudorhodoferax sp. Leaf274]
MLEVRNVSKTYVDGSVCVEALRGVNLSLGAECFSMLVGPSGSGKTTLLNLIGAIDTPSSGSIAIAGHDITALDDRKLTAFRAEHIGFIFQNFNLLPMLSAHENVEYALLGTQLSAAHRRNRSIEALAAVGLAQHAHHRPNQMSGGQRQRVAVARALVKRPSIVLADEPTANLDSEMGASMIRLMREMQAQYRTTFIFSTHDPELMRHADQLISIRDGRIEQRTAAGEGRAP